MDDPTVNRDKWGSKLDFILSCLGYAVGLGNVWRFPFRCAQGGGASFLIPYLIMMVFAGFPVFYMELALGQYCGLSPHILYGRMCPAFAGIGYTMVAIAVCTGIYYNMILGWSLYYLGQSMQYTVPWTNCKSPWGRMGECVVGGQSQNGTAKTAAELFFKYSIGAIKNVDGLENPKWEMVLALAGAWVLVYLCLLKGIKSSGKVVYFTATFPYVLLFILLVRGVTLSGAENGLAFYFFKPNMTKLGEGKVWSLAANQIFFSLSLGGGGLSTLASYNKFKNNLLRDSLIVVLGNCATSLFAGFAIFSVVGHVAELRNISVASMIEDGGGAGLAFEVYPVALSQLQPVQLWSIMFFFMLMLLGIDSQMVIVEVVMTTIFDQWPKLRKWPTKALVLLGVCGIQFVVGLFLTVPRGSLILDFIDKFTGGFTLVIACLAEVCMVSYAYGIKRFIGDIKLMLGEPPNKAWRYLGYPVNPYWIANWVVITPVLLLFVLIFTWVTYEQIECGKDNPCPGWFQALGWLLTAAVTIFIPLMAVKACVQALMQNKGLKWVITPTDKWGPNDSEAKKKLGQRMGGQQNDLVEAPAYDNQAYYVTPTGKHRDINNLASLQSGAIPADEKHSVKPSDLNKRTVWEEVSLGEESTEL